MFAVELGSLKLPELTELCRPSDTQRDNRRRWKGGRAEHVEIEEVNRAADQLIVRLARGEVRTVRRLQRQAPVLA